MSESGAEDQSGAAKATSDWDDEKLSALFPDGVLVTFVEGTEETSKHDNSAQDAAAKVQATTDEDGNLVFQFWSLNTGRHFLVPVEEVEERQYGLFVTPTENLMRPLMLSHDMSENQRQFIAEAKSQPF